MLEQLRKELKENVDETYKEGAERYFKETMTCYGVRTPIARKLGRKYFKQIKNLSKQEIFEIVETMLKTGIQEEATIAIQFTYEIRNKFVKQDFNLFEKWLENYIDNWAKDDYFCTYILNFMIKKFPELILKIKNWTKSENRWVRRASAVSFITTDKEFYNSLEYVFEIAELLLEDKDDLVQKGYGWMLKVASNFRQQEIFEFVINHKKAMPRTALRYAIEKMPRNLKEKAMLK